MTQVEKLQVGLNEKNKDKIIVYAEMLSAYTIIIVLMNIFTLLFLLS